MPVLLAPEDAIALPDLLAQANTLGQPYRIHPAGSALRIRGLSSLHAAGPEDISFLSNPKLHAQLLDCRAGAVALTQGVYDTLPQPARSRFVAVLCPQPYGLYAVLAQWFDQHRLSRAPCGIHASAVIAPSARIGQGVHIAPYCVVEEHAVIGDGCRLGPGCVIGQGARLGKDCLLHARVTLYHGVRVGDRAILHTGVVLGADGFGFAPHPVPSPGDAGAWVKIAQLGGVRVGDDVEIGANTTVDRGALDDTILGNGVKLDNQIMIAHNCRVGDHTAMAACVGVAGSTTIGRRCSIGGAAMISGHLQLTDDVVISGGTAVTSSILKPGRYTGVYPYAEHRDWQRNAAVVSQLGQLRRRLRALQTPPSLT